MRQRLYVWLNTLPPISNPIEQQQAPSLLLFMFVLVIAATLWMLLPLITAGTTLGLTLGILAPLLVVGGCVAGILVLRKGQFTRAVVLVTSALTIGVAVVMWAWGLRSSNGMLLVLLMNITLTGILAARRILLITALSSVGVVITLSLLEIFAPTMIGLAPLRGNANILSVGTFFLVTGVEIALFIQFSASLRDLLQRALMREFDLEQLRDSLEQTVVNRTASLRQALRDVEERETALKDTMQALQSSQAALRELNVPIVPVLPGILIIPLIGEIDDDRSALMIEQVLSKVQQARASHVIVDITAVPMVDTAVAHTLIEMGTALRLLGTDIMLVGIRPEVAQTLVSLNLDLGSIATYSDLQAAVLRLLPGRG